MSFHLTIEIGSGKKEQGCDAAPYFRIFNPTEQLNKFVVF